MSGIGFHDEIERVDAACARLARVRDDLAGIRSTAAMLARETAWQSAAAAAFRLAVDEWTVGLLALERRIDGVDDALQRARSMLVALTRSDT